MFLCGIDGSHRTMASEEIDRQSKERANQELERKKQELERKKQESEREKEECRRRGKSHPSIRVEFLPQQLRIYLAKLSAPQMKSDSRCFDGYIQGIATTGMFIFSRSASKALVNGCSRLLSFNGG
jgi:acetyl-CoA carboxylase carboxyltransferase component